MSNDNHYSGAHLLLTFLAGAVAGTMVALLTTPRTGPEAREKMRELGRDVTDKAQTYGKVARETYDRASTVAKKVFQKGTDEAADADEETADA